MLAGAFLLLFAGAYIQHRRSFQLYPRSRAAEPPAAGADDAPPPAIEDADLQKTRVSHGAAALDFDDGYDSEPPAWLTAGRCTPPAAAPAKRSSLGECACPLRQASAAWAGFDCGVFDARVRAGLAPWADASANLSHAALDAAWALTTANIPPAFHISVHGGTVYYKRQGPRSAYDERLLSLLKTVAARVPLPDVEFVLHPWDHQKVPRQDPVPVFGFTSGPASNDILFPYPYAWQENGFDLSSVACGAERRRQADRPQARVFWRGRSSGTGAALPSSRLPAERPSERETEPLRRPSAQAPAPRQG